MEANPEARVLRTLTDAGIDQLDVASLPTGLLGAYGSATSTSFNGFQCGAYINVLEATDFQ